ncbi:hypothetical protein IQ07DRAFT_599700 [Pyrenochaeta sp. DS3sAY3a]|nr:hypothetical protein IQ07DRAFT_599700 [Pyrenochaeta sp. DS3sAY3a]
MGSVWAIGESHLSNDPEVLPLPGSIFILLNCEISVRNYTYSIKNGVLDFGNPTNLANEESTYVVMDLVPDLLNREMYQAMRLAVASFDSSDQIASFVSIQLPQIALAYSAGMFTPMYHRNQRERQNLDVAKVPLPLVILVVIFGYLMGIGGLVFAVLACTSLKHSSDSLLKRESLKLEELVKKAKSEV